MGHNIELDQVSMIENALKNYEGFTSGEKKYCMDHLPEWVTSENSLDIMINQLAEKSLDARPFLERIGLLK
jgi:hypothetical protein